MVCCFIFKVTLQQTPVFAFYQVSMASQKVFSYQTSITHCRYGFGSTFTATRLPLSSSTAPTHVLVSRTPGGKRAAKITMVSKQVAIITVEGMKTLCFVVLLRSLPVSSNESTPSPPPPTFISQFPNERVTVAMPALRHFATALLAPLQLHAVCRGRNVRTLTDSAGMRTIAERAPTEFNNGYG